MVATEACPSVAATRWIGAPRSRAWVAWAWRSQWGDTPARRPARLAAASTRRCAWRTRSPRHAPALAGAEHRRVRLRAGSPVRPRPPQGQQVGPHGRRQEHRPRLAPLAVDRHLPLPPSARPGLEVAPAQGHQLGHPQPPGVAQAQERPVAGVGLQGQQAVHLRLGQAGCRACEAVAHLDWNAGER